VKLAHTAYDVVVGPELLQNLEQHLKRAGLNGPFLVVSQPRIFKAIGKSIPKEYPVTLIPDGERAKTLGTVSRVLDNLMKLKMNRQSTLIALGGGVVGDVSGFAASIYMRGISVVQAPTTLLAQVDSSIGGKTGVNHPAGKNMIGTFHQPSLVLSDSTTLRTLPDREYASGLYEALKYGIICDPDLFRKFVFSIDSILNRERESLEWLVGRCAGIKAKVVSKDEKEGDLRRVLNLGHTIGHALEAATHYRGITHGEAVGYGMIGVCRISAALGKMPAAQAQKVEVAIAMIGKLPPLNGIKLEPVMQALQHDKKVKDGAIHFVLPRDIGKVEITRDVPVSLVRDTVKTLINESKRKP
jgi:3-dehydroquinate synthase